MDEPEQSSCVRCGKTFTDSRVTPDVEVVVEAEAIKDDLEAVFWLCDDCLHFAQQFKERGVDGG